MYPTLDAANDPFIQQVRHYPLTRGANSSTSSTRQIFALRTNVSSELAVESEARMYMRCVRQCQVERRGRFRRMRSSLSMRVIMSCTSPTVVRLPLISATSLLSSLSARTATSC
ncbi:hypothetical protein K443DRAFT_650164 [Laccaria amethystina LaAM-08-1]|uniref:Uncharacterized protein n=1 Tax=Laccaria amethystina LaAM-08-1 TaxID=1095629 RepID=A0A0C9Y7M0_9AGAR|nr:hypothetical protein K443DRAFT_650164 [Laccaria amethystina LaAM-08-1]